MDIREKNVVETIKLGTITSEISAREVEDDGGKFKTYYDVDIYRTFKKRGSEEQIITKSFQYKDLDKLTDVVIMTKRKLEGLLRKLREQAL